MTSLSSLLLTAQEAKANATAAICAAKRLPETKDELFKEVAPFWESFGYDKEHGGFICGLQHDGSVSDDSKFSWYQGRGAWVFSKLYKMTGSEKFLKMAKGALLFTLNHCSVYGKDAQQPQTLSCTTASALLNKQAGCCSPFSQQLSKCNTDHNTCHIAAQAPQLRPRHLLHDGLSI